MPFCKIDGLQIHYQTPADLTNPQGQRILYVHGTGCNGGLWNRHMAEIAEAHTPVAIDLPGHGKSSGAGFRGVADYTHFVMELASSFGWERYLVAGHSLGGAIALATATYDHTHVSGMLLIDTGARLRVNPEILDAAREAAAQGQAIPLPRWSFAEKTTQSVIDAVGRKFADTPPEVTLKDWISDDSFDFLNRLGNITVPTLAICGQEDQLTPVRYHEFFRDHLPNCQLEVVPDSGHWPYAEQPELFDRAVRGFLDSLPNPC
jgi:pimeloyl-ACP methyl ester carboxylesterase